MTYKVVKEIKRKGFPTSSKYYKSSHSEADIEEKKKYPKGYVKLKKIDAKIPKGELIGKNTKSGKIEVSKRAPKKLRKEIAYHEKIESKNIKRSRR
ncbi:hypothetical protein UFOVP265_21 [uncultured Caudovirales phage]|uniref:Uncharacterized protein n=1 Tax=uncultured Caudovirales phage TaxID=2100421 RepID=A0A6J5LH53_9CAUD|nr:hypothetical protein UFOVP265_21 [uncultured Caudovirales phage]